MTRSERYRPVLFWLAVATAATALLPIVVGALVTTLDAGMAFRDWPTSDGQGMLSYPWLHSAGDKFVEHGHRLAGIMIGCVSIVFAAVGLDSGAAALGPLVRPRRAAGGRSCRACWEEAGCWPTRGCSQWFHGGLRRGRLCLHVVDGPRPQPLVDRTAPRPGGNGPTAS